MTESDPEFEVEYQAELKRIKLQRARDKARRDSEDLREQFVMVKCWGHQDLSFPIRIKDLDWSSDWEPESEYWIYKWNLTGVLIGTDRKGHYYFPADIESADKIKSYLDSR